MNNKEIAKQFQLLAKLMDLHGENQFKSRSYSSAYITLRKWPDELSEMNPEAISEIPGIGKALQDKIQELLQTGEMQVMNTYFDMTPEGVVNMLRIKGFGPKKVKTVWEDLGIESVGELLYAVNENRLVELKGFGAKTQATLKIQLEYFIESSNKVHFAVAEKIALELISFLKPTYPQNNIQLTGSIYRKDQVIDTISVIADVESAVIIEELSKNDAYNKIDEKHYYHNIEVELIYSSSEEFCYNLVKSSCGSKFWEALKIESSPYESQEDVFEKNNLNYIIPEFREDSNLEFLNQYTNAHAIVDVGDIRGCIHNHSTYSDGINTIEEMVAASLDKGYEYFVLSDHSRSAFYTNGLQIERLYQQLEEIRTIDQQESDFRLFSGIESDILSTGELDYPDDVLAEIEIVIASVHSNLQMDEEKATKRLIKAIENPYTSILGHPTGRLLLSRKGYPIDHKKIIDACADNNVAIEINANPNRLDLDWTWIQYAMQKDVLLSINPDAHSIEGINDIYYGVCVARKGGLLRSMCLNAFDQEEFEEWVIEQHEKR